MLPRKDGAFLALAVVLGILIVKQTNAVDVESHNIPSHLQDCYQNDSLYHRENRLPSTISNVVSILRQIEESPGFTMDMRSLALSLLHMFRVDGVERNPEVVASEHTIPFGLTGSQYYKYHLLMNGLIPRSSFLFPNETLTDKEKCTLHFMMSDSLDKPQRGDEHTTCQFAQYRASATSRRHRRSVIEPDDEVEVVPQSTENDAGLVNDNEDSSLPIVVSGPVADNSDAEMLDLNNSKEHPVGKERKGDLMWNKDGEGPPSHGKILGPPGATARLETPPSACPVENGVVYSRWGSIQLGTVLAGIATGFETQLVQLKDLRKNPASKFTNPKVVSGSLEIDNRYAATLAGDLAEVALWRGPKGGMSIGASGNWNSTQYPRWYFINRENEMTDAEMRGGLDGLIMAHQVKEWNNMVNGQLKLSTLLERYYSARGIFDEQYRACERQKHYKRVAASATLEDQTANFGYLLFDTTPGMPTITSEGVAVYASQAIEVLDKTIPSNLESQCENLGRSPDDIELVVKADIKFIVDCSYSYTTISEMLSSLSNHLQLHPQRSSITVYGAKNYEELFQKSERNHEFLNNIQENRTEYDQCTPGVDLKNLLENHLENIYTELLEQEKSETDATHKSQIVVIMPSANYNLQGQESRDVDSLVEKYKQTFPDVIFIIFAPSVKENFNILVQNSETDIITFNVNDIDVVPLVSRLGEVHQRIANPTCGINWKGHDYGSLSVYDKVPSDNIQYYRIHQKYLFGAGEVKVQVQEENVGTVRVCHSRKIMHPSDDDSDENDDIECEDISNTAHDIILHNPCGNTKSSLSCAPLYISVQTKERRGSCRDRQCFDADDFPISITHSGLTCGAAAVLATPLICIMTIVTLIKTLLII